MSTHIPTIQELRCKADHELQAIFRQAADVSANAKRAEAERAAARQTLENIRRVRPGRDRAP